MNHNNIYHHFPSSDSSISSNLLRLQGSSHSIDIANLILSPFSKIGQEERKCAGALLEAIVYKVGAPYSKYSSRKLVEVASAYPTQLLAIAVHVGIDVRDARFNHGLGRDFDTFELIRRVVVACARNVGNACQCIESRDRGLAYLKQDLRWLRRAHRGYRIYHKYGVRIGTQFTGEWFDRGEEAFEVGLDMWEQEGEGERGRGWVKKVVAALR